MADAVLTQRLLVGGAALAGLFLIVLLLVAAFWLLARLAGHFREAAALCEQLIAEAVAEPTSTRAVLDTEPGINLADLDECARILAATEQAGWDRLRAAIRDEQQKGD